MNKINNNKSGGRVDWLDSSRGIAIILVVLGHCIGYVDNHLNKLILSFHMPAFFFLSGLCINMSYSITDYIKRRFMRIVGWQLLIAAICIGYDFIRSHSLNLEENLFIWFLPVLFFSEIVFLLISKITLINLKVCALLIIFGGMLQLFSLHTMVHIEIIPTAVVFIALGFACKHYLFDTCCEKVIGKSWVFLLPILVLLAEMNDPVMMYNNDYGNFVFFIITGIVGSVGICILGRLWEKNTLLKSFGQNSILVYVLHFRMAGILHFLFSKIFLITYDLYLYPYYWMFFILELFILYFLIVLYTRWRNYNY